MVRLIHVGGFHNVIILFGYTLEIDQAVILPYITRRHVETCREDKLHKVRYEQK